MSLDSEVPPSQYLNSESRENTRLLKSLAKKSSSLSNGNSISTSSKIKAISSKIQNCQEYVTEVDTKVEAVDEKYTAELKEMREEFEQRLASTEKTNEADNTKAELKKMREEFEKRLTSMEHSWEEEEMEKITDAGKTKEMDVAIKEIYKKMTYIESIVLDLSKSFYGMDDTELKNLVSKTVSPTPKTISTTTSQSVATTTTPVTKPTPDIVKPADLDGGASYSIRTQDINYEI